MKLTKKMNLGSVKPSILPIEEGVKLMNGTRFHTTSQSMKCDLDLMEEILDIHTEVVKALEGREAFLPELLFQPFVRTMLPKDDMGNTFGIKPEDCPLISKSLFSLSSQHFY